MNEYKAPSVYFYKAGRRGVREHFASMRRVWHCVDCMAGIRGMQQGCRENCETRALGEEYLETLGRR